MASEEYSLNGKKEYLPVTRVSGAFVSFSPGYPYWYVHQDDIELKPYHVHHFAMCECGESK